MAEHSDIEWTDTTWNPITGCRVVSPGCTNCYAMRLAGTRLRHHASRAGLTVETKAGPVWNGKVRFNRDWLDQPLNWKRPRRIFVCAHGDLFAEGVTDEMIDEVFAVMALADRHTFQVLTKRPERMREYLEALPQPRWLAIIARRRAERGLPGALLSTVNGCLRNVWLGVSVEDQERADQRIAVLMETPAHRRFISAEPLLGPIDLRLWLHESTCLLPEDGPCTCHEPLEAVLDWVIVGGESGPDARPMHPDWARRIRDDCAAAGVPFFFKQHGSWRVHVDRERQDPDWRLDYSAMRKAPRFRFLNSAGGIGFHGDRFLVMERVDKGVAGRELDGVTHDAMPELA